MKDVCLHGLAKMMRFGATPMSSKVLISDLLAQSKLDPSLTINRMISRSGLDFIAKKKYFH